MKKMSTAKAVARTAGREVQYNRIERAGVEEKEAPGHEDRAEAGYQPRRQEGPGGEGGADQDPPTGHQQLPMAAFFCRWALPAALLGGCVRSIGMTPARFYLALLMKQEAHHVVLEGVAALAIPEALLVPRVDPFQGRHPGADGGRVSGVPERVAVQTP